MRDQSGLGSGIDRTVPATSELGRSTMGNGPDSAYRAALPASPAEAPVEDAIGFDAFVREQYDPLLHFLRRSRMDDEPEDVAQESLARFLPYAGRQPRAAWKPTLYRIAINLVNDRLRRKRFRQTYQHVPLEGLEVASDAPDLEEAAALAQQQARLREAIRALPPQCRQVYLLKLVRDMTNAEIARRCGISTRMVEKHLANALLHIRRRFGSAAPDA